MLPEPYTLIGSARWIVLLFCFGWAAWSDHKERRVPNEHWIVWVKPIVIIWALELMLRDADWTIWATAAGVIAYASISVIGRPTLEDVMSGNKIDQIVSLWYVIGIVGFVTGLYKYAFTDISTILDRSADSKAVLWFETVSAFIVIFIFNMAWKFRLLHGGADAKAMIWATMLMPSWMTLQPIWKPANSLTLQSPPAIALLLWGGIIFLFLPLIILFINIKNGDVKQINDLKMAWHSTRMKLDEVMKNHVWLLDEVIENPNGELGVYSRTRPPSRTPDEESLHKQIRALKEIGQESAWVTHKYPLLVFMFPGIIAMFAFGDPMGWIFSLLE